MHETSLCLFSAYFETSSNKTQGVTPLTNAMVFNATTVGAEYQLSESNLLADPKHLGGILGKEYSLVKVYNSFFIGEPTGAQNP